MKINNETFMQMISLDAEDLSELINTIGMVCRHRDQAGGSNMVLASLFMNYGTELFESQGCEVAMKIQHKEWESSIVYG